MSLCEQRGTGTERSKNLREQSGERESKKIEHSRAEQGAGGRGAGAER